MLWSWNLQLKKHQQQSTKKSAIGLLFCFFNLMSNSLEDDRGNMSSTFSRVGGSFATVGHAGRWKLLRLCVRGFSPSHRHTSPKQLIENMKISHRGASAVCYWTLNSQLSALCGWAMKNGGSQLRTHAHTPVCTTMHKLQKNGSKSWSYFLHLKKKTKNKKNTSSEQSISEEGCWIKKI